jgi:hypothetical protein
MCKASLGLTFTTTGKQCLKSVWARNPFFAFVPTDVEPNLNNGERLDRSENGQSSLFGLEAALRWSWTRVRRLGTWESWRDPDTLGYCEPLTEEVVAARLVGLHAQRAGVMRHHRRWRGWWLCAFILEKVAGILAHDSGLLDYRIHLVMGHFLRAFNRITRNYPMPAACGPVRRPPFEPPYVDVLFHIILMNPCGIRQVSPYWI